MCVGCALTAASAATGFRSWLQNHHFGWLTPRRLRALTLGAMSAAAVFASVGLSASSKAHASQRTAPAGQLGPGR